MGPGCTRRAGKATADASASPQDDNLLGGQDDNDGCPQFVGSHSCAKCAHEMGHPVLIVTGIWNLVNFLHAIRIVTGCASATMSSLFHVSRQLIRDISGVKRGTKR